MTPTPSSRGHQDGGELSWASLRTGAWLAGDRLLTRGNRFRSRALEAMSSTYGTHCLGLAGLEPISSRLMAGRAQSFAGEGQERRRVVEGQGLAGRVDLCGRRVIKK